MSILAFCQWLADTPLGVVMRTSTWDFTFAEIGHLIGLAIFGGAVFLLNLRFLDLAFVGQPLSQVAREFLPLTVGGLVVMVVSGFLMLANAPLRYYYNPVFQFKISLFVVALIVQFAIQIKQARASAGQTPGSPQLRLGALVSLLLWLSIGLAGRAIGYA